jgi:hypothetical protein
LFVNSTMIGANQKFQPQEHLYSLVRPNQASASGGGVPWVADQIAQMSHYDTLPIGYKANANNPREC